MNFESNDTQIVDISPLHCGQCGHVVEIEDAFCARCGFNLMEVLPQLCANCGKALPPSAHFCTTCGRPTSAPDVATASGPTVTPQAIEHSVDGDEDDEPPAKPRRKRLRRWVVAILTLLALGAASSAGAWWWANRPDFETYDAIMREAVALTQRMQSALDEVAGPDELEGLTAALAQLERDLKPIEGDASTIPDAEFKKSARAVISLQQDVLAELNRLATLSSADVDAVEFTRIDELTDVLSEAIDDARDLREGKLELDEVSLSTAALRSALMDLAAYREEVLKERARIRHANAKREDKLAEVEAFVAEFDGIIARYSGARGELADWIEGVDQFGATFIEAYQVLEAQADRRRQLRDELAALEAPAEFAADKEAVLAVMDQAVDATEAAYRGISEFQFDWRYRKYDQTPGWQEFEASTDAISDNYSAALSEYELRKDDVLDRLSRRTPLPELPD